MNILTELTQFYRVPISFTRKDVCRYWCHDHFGPFASHHNLVLNLENRIVYRDARVSGEGDYLNGIWDDAETKDGHVFLFQNETDAVHFKLRWGAAE